MVHWVSRQAPSSLQFKVIHEATGEERGRRGIETVAIPNRLPEPLASGRGSSRADESLRLLRRDRSEDWKKSSAMQQLPGASFCCLILAPKVEAKVCFGEG